MSQTMLIRLLKRQAYKPVWQAMKDFTGRRDCQSQDEIWFVEHDPIFTQGQAGKSEHILAPGDIPVIKSDRGGQVTYHGPGQLIIYLMLDVARKCSGPRKIITALEDSVIQLLKGYRITGYSRRDAPGVYVGDAKLASVGMRFRKMRSYHGMSINVDMDLEPFKRINPCGYAGQPVITLKELYSKATMANITEDILACLLTELCYSDYRYASDSVLPC